MWDDINKAKENFVTVENSLHNIEADVLQMQKHLEEIDSFVAVLNGYTHLQDIDNMWDDLDVCKKNIEKINENIQTQQSELNNLATTSKNHTESIATLSKKMVATEEYAVDSRNLITKLEAFKEEVSALNHLMEVDEIWKQTEEHQTRINRVEQECKANTDKLSGISHLDDVDGMWNSVEEHTSKLIKCEKRDEELADAIQKNKEEVNENIAEAVRTANAAIETLTKKVKYAYWIAGGTAGLAIIELILLLV
jgi:predicted  nucleic acid-binding Zn-ribbon protein